MSNIVGKWAIQTDWDCDGRIDGTTTINFKQDGTWDVYEEENGEFYVLHYGKWFQKEKMIIFAFDDTPGLVYAGNVSGNRMSGIQGTNPKGQNGCFSGRKNKHHSEEKTDETNSEPAE